MSASRTGSKLRTHSSLSGAASPSLVKFRASSSLSRATTAAATNSVQSRSVTRMSNRADSQMTWHSVSAAPSPSPRPPRCAPLRPAESPRIPLEAWAAVESDRPLFNSEESLEHEAGLPDEHHSKLANAMGSIINCRLWEQDLRFRPRGLPVSGVKYSQTEEESADSQNVDAEKSQSYRKGRLLGPTTQGLHMRRTGTPAPEPPEIVADRSPPWSALLGRLSIRAGTPDVTQASYPHLRPVRASPRAVVGMPGW